MHAMTGYGIAICMCVRTYVRMHNVTTIYSLLKVPAPDTGESHVQSEIRLQGQCKDEAR